MPEWSGCFTALVTPFSGNGVNPPVDLPAYRKLVRLQESAGIAGVIPCGTTGESPTLTHAEKNLLIEAAVSESKSMLVLAGTGGNCTRDAIELTTHAEDAGADGSLQVCPYYNKPNQDGLFHHFSAIASSADFPIILYNVPPRTSREIAPATMARLAREHSNIVGVKEASGSPETWKAIREQCGAEFTILSGNDSDTLGLMRDFGATGVISVASNPAPQRMANFVSLGRAGKFEEMSDEQARLSPYFDALFIDTNPIMVKHAMEELGLPAGGFRLPLCATSEDKREKLRTVLASMGLVAAKVPASD